jgi:transposase-like protein
MNVACALMSLPLMFRTCPRGQTIDFLLSAKREAGAAKRFFRETLAQSHTVNPRTITVDKNAAYPAPVPLSGRAFALNAGN